MPTIDRIPPPWPKQHKTREQIADEWLPQVERWVKGYVKKKPEWSTHYFDFLANATIKLMERIDDFLGKNKEFGDHFSSGLRITIMNDIYSFLRQEYAVRRKKPSRDVYRVWNGSTDVSGSDDETFLDYLKDREPLPLASVCDPPYVEISPEEKLFEACKDDIDVAIVQARFDGLNRVNVAKRVAVSINTVRRRLKQLRKRYDST